MIEFKDYNQDDDIVWIHNPKQKPLKQTNKEAQKESQKILKLFENADSKIKKVKEKVLLQELSRTAERIVEIIDMDEQETKKVFFVNFSKGQTLDLQRFLKEMNSQCSKKWKNRNMTLVKVKEEDVMSILMKIYTFLEDSGGSHMVFLIQRITNFDYKDIRSLRRSLQKGHYSIIIPTYKSLIEVDGLSYSGFYHLTLYNHKQLLVEFMVRIFLDNTIKAYLPPQILNLIQDLDYYPISYRESVRRYTICLKKSILYNFYNNDAPQPKTDYLSLYNSIVDVLSACTPRGEVKIQDRFIRAVYDKTHMFRIPRSIVEVALTKEEKFNEKVKSVEYSNLDRIIHKFRKKFDFEPLLKKYVDMIGDVPQTIQMPVKSKNPRDRSNALEIPKTITDRSQQLNKQLTKIIRDVTEDVRKHASKTPWNQISYDPLCRPQLSSMICKDVNQNIKLSVLFNSGNKTYQTGHKDNFTDSGMRIAEYHYHMAELEFLGLVENTKKQIDPTFINQVYHKLDYRGI